MAEFDNYLPCEQYSAAPDSDRSPGFKTWLEESSNSWYFAVVTNRKRVVLRSEAYASEAARDNGIDSVNRNRDIEERYSVVESDGKWYVILKAGNHQEIARSCPHDSEAAARADIAMCASNAVDTMGIVEDYLPCESYGGHAASEKYPGFSTFTHDGQHYFAMTDGAGNVMLRSEAYTTPASRDNGIESVNRNRDEKERFSIVQNEEDGQYYIVLKAGNHQEIARSCAFESADGAQAILDRSFATPRAATIVEDYLPCEAYGGDHSKSEKHPDFVTFNQEGLHYFALNDGAGNVMLRSEGYTTASARDNGIESVNRNRDDKERYAIIQDEDDSQLYIVLKAGNHQEIARSCPFESVAAAQAILDRSFAKPHPTAVVEDYLACEAYANQTGSEKFPGFTVFTDGGQHYFAMVDGHGGVILRSEAYKSPAARDNGIESVLRNRDIEERYEIKQDEGDGKWYTCLKAGNHQEIARSCGFDDQATAEAHLLHCYSKKALEDIATGAGQIIEDYLPCEDYRHGEKSAFDGFSIFQDQKTKLHYFAMIEDDGKVTLKSEGYKDPKRRDNGIESVIRNRGTKDHWRELQDDHGYYMSLRAVNHQEIARSCHYKDSAAMLAWFLPFLAGHAAWGNDAEPEEVVAAPVTTAATIAAPLVAAAAAATSSSSSSSSSTPPAAATMTTHTNAPAAAAGGSDWWKWLLGLLLLGALLWLLMRGCNNKPEPAAPAMAPPTTTAPVTAPAEAAPAPAPAPAPAAATCNCSAQTDPVFRTPTGTPKSLTRLGTNPEFGNSHDLSPAEFYAKLAKQYKNNAVDRKFLDRMFNAMGYNGFADAKADQFTAVEVPAGTAGNMGYSKDHKTAYDRLDATGKDLLAFRIKAANGCDLHFMKTCGNHFFFCPK